MKRSKIQQYQKLTRVAHFAELHAEQFPKDTSAGGLREAIRADVHQLSGHLSAQVSAETMIRVSAQSRIGARQELTSLLKAMEVTGLALKMDKFRMPRQRTDQALIDAGKSFIKDAEPLSKEFALQGLPNIVETLSAAISKLEGAILTQVSSRANRSAAIREFDKTMEEAIDHFRRFKALVGNTMAGKQAVLAAWDVACLVYRSGGTKTMAEPEVELNVQTIPAAATPTSLESTA